MTARTISSRQFNQNSSGAKKSANSGPVYITDRGKPSHVLLTIEEYRRLTGETASIVDMLAMKSSAEVEFNPPKLDRLARQVDLN